MPIFRSDKRSDKGPDMAQKARSFLSAVDSVLRGAPPDAERRENNARNPKGDVRRSPTPERRKEIESKRQELHDKKQQFQRIKAEQWTAEERTKIIDKHLRSIREVQQEIFQLEREHLKSIREVQQEIFQLERELRATEEGWAGDEPLTGALPDFVVVGVGKGGTTFLYHLLSQHPHVEAAALKEPRFFDHLFEEGVDWYRQLFPHPRLKDGRKTITGEATPYLNHPLAPERMARVVPHARLIALLRNPVDRAYSRYHQLVRHESETRTFEEVVEAEKAWLLEAFQPGYRAGFDVAFGDLYKGIYVDQLLRWSECFSKEQMLVLKSEDFFEDPVETLKQVLDFLGLTEWEPEPSQLWKKRNTHEYEEMNPATRRGLEEFFEPHNKRLYEYLGEDLGW